ncbi:adhesion G-protein coupled receptor G2 isoform X2 [Mixophyes fleayi]|uniref:adhesion G-protein coupled receptor G2 isoform X2 n=1 Tax=Mixophyes fleayi TaxID=3061075 RepID=UPI003F4E002F
MLLHGFLRAIIANTKHRPVKLKTTKPICILMCILVIPEIAHAVDYGEYKAVFSTPCEDIMTLSSPVPDLTKFTLCTYLKLASLDPWTAFIYKLTSSAVNVYEIGVFGDSSSMTIWMFGTEINVLETLNLNTWYDVCIKWDGKTESMEFYLDGTLKAERKLENNTTLKGGGNLILGCPNWKDMNASASLGLVGELYMFRMWNTVAGSWLQSCIDGNVIKWKMDYWIYSPVLVQQDSSLNCAKKTPGILSSGQNNNNIHMFYKRSATDVTSQSNVSTSISDTFWTSLTTTNFNSETNNYSSTTSLTTSFSKNTTNVFSNETSITPSATATNVTIVSSNWTSITPSATTTSVTIESMNCSSWIQTWLTDACNSSCNASGLTDACNSSCNASGLTDACNSSCNASGLTDACNSSCNGSAYEITFKDNVQNCSETGQLLLNYLQSIDNYTEYNQTNCTALVYRFNGSVTYICNFLKKNLPKNIALNIAEVNKVDYCCCSGCPLYCIRNNTSMCGIGGGGSGNSGGSQITTNNSIVTSFSNGYGTTSNNKSNTDVNSGFTSVAYSESNTSGNSGFTLPVNHPSKTTVTDALISTTNKSGTATTNKGSNTTVTDALISTTNNSGTATTNNGSDATAKTGSYSTRNSGYTTTFSITNVTNNSESSKSPSITKSSNITDDLNGFIKLLSSSNLNSTTVNKIVSRLEDLLTGEVTIDTARILIGILNSFLNVSQNLLAPVSKRLLLIVNKIGLKLTFSEQSIHFTSQAFALAVSKVNASSFNGTSFGVTSSSGLQVSLGSQATINSDGSIHLPASLLNQLPTDDKNVATRTQFNYFDKTSLFMDSSLTINQSLVSKVISSSFANITIANLKENVTVTLKTFPQNDSNFVLKCVFWDFTKNNENGGWSSYGCMVANIIQDTNETVCTCNHLTSFAILMDVTPNDPVNPEDTLILTFITYIGCGLSSIFLSVTLITYIAFEKIRRDYPSKILIQLCAALVCLNLTFLLNPWIALYNNIPGLCISVAAFLHYFVLVSITWMGLEAFHMYLSLVKVFNTYVRKYILKFCIVAWGAPAVVVAIILAVNKDLYKLRLSGTYPNGSADYFCWMDDMIFWITVVGYFGLIFLLNVSMFVVVLIQLCRIKKQKQLGYQRKTTLQDLRSVAGITFLLGITWGLGFFSFGPGKVAIMYLFTIFNTLQGFFIFLFYCVAKENVRKQWRRYLCCGRFRLAENSDWSKTATNKLKKQTSKQGVSSNSSNSIQSTSNSNSTTLLVSNEYSLHPNGNGNVFKERNGVSWQLQNGEMQLQEFPGRPSTRNGNAKQTSLRRTSNRGSVHFIDQI